MVQVFRLLELSYVFNSVLFLIYIFVKPFIFRTSGSNDVDSSYRPARSELRVEPTWCHSSQRIPTSLAGNSNVWYSACGAGTNVQCAPGLPGRLQSVLLLHVHKRFPGEVSESGYWPSFNVNINKTPLLLVMLVQVFRLLELSYVFNVFNLILMRPVSWD